MLVANRELVSADGAPPLGCGPAGLWVGRDAWCGAWVQLGRKGSCSDLGKILEWLS